MSQNNGSWAISEAKAKLSQLVAKASEGPQIITNRGRDSAVVLSIDDYRHLVEQAVAAMPEQRWRGFLEASAAIRAAGGGELDVGRRAGRSSPFER